MIDRNGVAPFCFPCLCICVGGTLKGLVAFRPSQVDSQFIVPAHMYFKEQSKIFIIYFPGSVYVLSSFYSKIMAWGDTWNDGCYIP